MGDEDALDHGITFGIGKLFPVLLHRWFFLSLYQYQRVERTSMPKRFFRSAIVVPVSCGKATSAWTCCLFSLFRLEGLVARGLADVTECSSVVCGVGGVPP